MLVRTAVGKQSRRFMSQGGAKPCVIGGVLFEDHPGFDDQSDGDVVFGSICEAFATIMDAEVVYNALENLCENQGITDSQAYVEELAAELKGQKVTHVAINIEGKEPKVRSALSKMRVNVANALGITPQQVGISVISGAGLTEVGCGEGLTAICVMTTESITTEEDF